MAHDTFRPLTTDRLVLRLVEEDDLEAIWSYRSRPEVRTWISGSLDEEAFRHRFLDWPDGLQQLAIVEDDRVVAECFADNEPSWRLMERIGMRREAHHVRSALHREHGWKDELTYALLADERG